MHKYSKTTDLIYPSQILSRYKDLPDDLIDITETEAHIHMGNIPAPEGMQRKKHYYPFEFEPIPQPTGEQLAQQAQSEMVTELNWCDLQLKYHATGDTKRAISTVELINAYAVECRDYVQNVDGVLAIVGDKPERPE